MATGSVARGRCSSATCGSTAPSSGASPGRRSRSPVCGSSPSRCEPGKNSRQPLRSVAGSSAIHIVTMPCSRAAKPGGAKAMSWCQGFAEPTTGGLAHRKALISSPGPPAAPATTPSARPRSRCTASNSGTCTWMRSADRSTPGRAPAPCCQAAHPPMPGASSTKSPVETVRSRVSSSSRPTAPRSRASASPPASPGSRTNPFSRRSRESLSTILLSLSSRLIAANLPAHIAECSFSSFAAPAVVLPSVPCLCFRAMRSIGHRETHEERSEE